MLDKNRIVAYSLLAHINDHNEGIRDLADVYVPFVETALCSWDRKGDSFGRLRDLKREIDTHYGLDIPYPLVRQLLDEVSRRRLMDDGSPAVAVYGDGSFRVKRFGLSDFEDDLSKQESDLAFLEHLYTNHCEKQAPGAKADVNRLYELLDLHRAELCSLMADGGATLALDSYGTEIEFIGTCRKRHRASAILRKLYVGSVIASYLQLAPHPAKVGSVEYLLDTSLILALLDLGSVQSRHTAVFLRDMIQALGQTLAVMDITADETTSLLRRVAESLEHSIFTAHLDPESIEAACDRRHLSRTDLERIASRVVDSLREKHGVVMLELPKEVEKQALASNVYELTKKRPYNPGGAHHDGVLFYYVQERRGRRVKTFHEASCWFVGIGTDQRRLVYTRPDGTLGERLNAEYAVSILWLAHPNRANDLAEIGLGQLVSRSLGDQLPSPALIRELDHNIRRFSSAELSEEDLALVASSTAARTLDNFRELHESSQGSAGAFAVVVGRLARDERAAQKRAKDEHARAIETAGNQLRETAQELATATAKADETRDALRSIMQDQLGQTQKTLVTLRQTACSIATRAKRRVRLRTVGVVGCVVAAAIAGEVLFSSVVPIVSTVVSMVCGYGYGLWTGRSLNPVTMHERWLAAAEDRERQNVGYSVEQLEGLKNKEQALRDELGVNDSHDPR